MLAALLDADSALSEALAGPGLRPSVAALAERSDEEALAAFARLLLWAWAALRGRVERNAPDRLAEMHAAVAERVAAGRVDLGGLGWSLAAGAPAANDPRRSVLDTHLAALEAGHVDMEAAARASIDLALEAGTERALLAAMTPDPVAAALGGPDPEIGMAQSVFLAIREAADAGWPAPPLATLLALRRVGEPLRDAMLWTGIDRTVRGRSSARLLLPLSIETRFVLDPVGADHRLRIRAMPDAPMAEAAPGAVTEDEAAALAAFHEAAEGIAADGIRSGGPVRTAWLRFTGGVGARRAVSLLRRFPPSLALHRENLRTVLGPPPNEDDVVLAVMRAMPRSLTFWVRRAGGAEEAVAETQVDVDALGVSIEDAATPRWWNDFDAAVAVGLAAEVPLGARADDVARVTVTGDGGPDGGAHLAALARDGQIVLLRHGARTNPVGGGPAADEGEGLAGWEAALLDPGPVTLCGVPVPVPYGRDEDFGALDGELVGGCWMALFAELSSTGPGGARALDLFDAARRTLRPRGPGQSLAIEGTPYGVLPVDLPGGGIAGGAAPAGLDGLEALARTAAEVAPTPPGPGDGDGIARLLSDGPASGGYQVGLARPGRYAVIEIPPDGRPGGDRIAPPAPPFDHLLPLELPLLWDDALPDDERAVELRDALASLLEGDGRMVELIPIGESKPPASLLCRVITVSLHAIARRIAAEEGSRLGDALRRLTGPSAGGGPALRVGQVAATDLRGLVGRLSAPGDPGAVLREIDAAFRALLDAASWRIDPALTAVALGRLNRLGAPPRLTIGAYGWVDAPAPATDGGRPSFHPAPSETQAQALALLGAGGETARLGGGAIRVCLELAQGLAEGRSAAEVLGAMAEARAVELDPLEAAASVDAIRRAFPLGGNGAPPATDGSALFTRFGQRDEDPARTAIKTSLATAFPDFWKDCLDIADRYAELTLLEGVHAFAAGRETQVGRLFGPGAGEPPPDRFDGVATPRAARGIATTVILAFPASLAAGDGPAALALGPLASWCADAVPGAITFEVVSEGGTRSLDLAALGIEPEDLALIGEAALQAHVEAIAGEGSARRPGAGTRAHAAILARAALAGAPARHGGSLPDAAHVALDEGEAWRRLGILTARAGRDAAAAKGATALRWSIGAGTEPTHLQRELGRRAGIVAAGDAVGDRLAAIGSVLGPEAPLRPYPSGRLRLGALTRIDEPGEWLGTLAAVRPQIALLDALSLADPGALELYATRADPFAPLGDDEDEGEVVVVLAPSGADLSGPVHCAVLDAWTEAVGDTAIDAAAAVRAPAPPARPPAALLMLPPGDWTPPYLVALTGWLETLMRARVARPADLDDALGGWSPQAFPAAVPFGPWLASE